MPQSSADFINQFKEEKPRHHRRPSFKSAPSSAPYSRNACVPINVPPRRNVPTRAMAWKKKEEQDKALEDFEQALRINPSNQRALHNRSFAMTMKTLRIMQGKRNDE